MVTYTPIPYWLSMPWGDVCEWEQTVIAIREEDSPAEQGDRG